MSKKITQRDFPLKEAYDFALQHGLSAEAQAIRMNPFTYDRKGLRDRSSGIRSGWMIILFESKGLFEEFQKEHWPWYDMERDKRHFRGYHWLVLLSSVLYINFPKSFYGDAATTVY